MQGGRFLEMPNWALPKRACSPLVVVPVWQPNFFSEALRARARLSYCARLITDTTRRSGAESCTRARDRFEDQGNKGEVRAIVEDDVYCSVAGKHFRLADGVAFYGWP